MRSHPYLRSLSVNGIRLGLDRIALFLESLGSPHLKYPVIHVAGTNGKGSVASMCEEIYVEAGIKVGVTTSPHLQHVNERVRVNGEPITDSQLEMVVLEVRERAHAWGLEHSIDGDPLTYFEAMVAVAFLHFARCEVDIAIIEVGLGGRLDATNVLSAGVSAITSIALDHCDRLGSDVGSIASEKAGIIGVDIDVVVGPLCKEAMQVVRLITMDKGATLHEPNVGYRIKTGSNGLSYLGLGTAIDGLKLGLEGAHQQSNAAVAISLVLAMGLRDSGLSVGEGAIREGLANARHPGRLEWVGDSILIDGAHNVESATALANYIQRLDAPEGCTLLLGASSDKNVRSIATTLAPYVNAVITTRCSHPRAMEPGDVAAQLVDLKLPVTPAGRVEEALEVAKGNGGIVVVAGSLFLAGAVRELCGR